MKCDCLTKIKTELTEHVRGKGVENPRVSEEFLRIDLSSGAAIISLAYRVHGDNRPYNSQKGKPLSMVASFCPFCGVPTK